ncbi:Selenate reductase assembly chaperone protein [Azoarcus sp. Aa7]|nr:Selenate reductase assembly chaperone protein [Azoarcus sp. Aa7]
MNAPDEFLDLSRSALGRSAMYAALSRAFTYEGAASGPVAIAGSDFNAAFDPSVSEQACSLREGAYAGGDQTALFEELMRFYGFFGLGRDEHAEMPDHLSVELEFMHFLTLQQERSAGQPEAIESLLRAQRDFISRHLLRLVRGVRTAFKSESPACRDLVELTEAFVSEDLQKNIKETS